MGAFQHYYWTEDDFELKIHRLLKLTACPHCKRIGNLILNGLIRRYSESSPLRIICGHYVICNHRRKGRKGCGKSFSVFLAKTIKYHSINTQSLWRFLQNIAFGKGTITAFRDVLISSFSDRTIHRFRAKFNNIQSKIRTRLLTVCSAPHCLTTNPLLQTIIHLKAAFTGIDDPIAQYQMRFNEKFF